MIKELSALLCALLGEHRLHLRAVVRWHLEALSLDLYRCAHERRRDQVWNDVNSYDKAPGFLSMPDTALPVTPPYSRWSPHLLHRLIYCTLDDTRRCHIKRYDTWRCVISFDTTQRHTSYRLIYDVWRCVISNDMTHLHVSYQHVTLCYIVWYDTTSHVISFDMKRDVVSYKTIWHIFTCHISTWRCVV